MPWPIVLLNWGLAFLLLAALCVFSFTRLSYAWNWPLIGKYNLFFINGWKTTLEISGLALVISTLIGLVAALARRSGLLVLRALSRFYVELIRGTPLLVQIMFAFYVVASAFRFDDRFAVGVLTLSLFSGAYISEIIRGGIESVGFTQLESARAIGLTRAQTYRFVIFPQAIRVILPAMAGMFANLIKDSSLLYVIAIQEFTWSGQNVSSLTYSNFECYLILAFGYLILTLPISLWTQWLEKKTKYET